MKYLLLFTLYLFSCSLPAQPIREYHEDGKTPKVRGQMKTTKIKQKYGPAYEQQSQVGTWRYYYDNGVLAKEENYGNDKARPGLANGVTRYYDSSGVLLKECTFQFGIQKGCKVISPGHFLFEKEEFTIDENGNNSSPQDTVSIRTASGKVIAPPKKKTYQLVVGDAALKSAQDWQKDFIARRIPTLDPLGEENLVQNPTFLVYDAEELDPRKRLPFYKWSSALFTPDFTDEGKNQGRVGIRVSSTEDQRVEAIYNELVRPLQDTQWYCFQMRAKLSKASSIATNGLAVFFQDQPGKYDFMYYQTIQPHLILPADRILSEVNDYVLISGAYRAKGGERAVVIGGFRPLEQTRIYPLQGYVGLEAEAYYWIDDVVLSPVGDSIDCPCNMEYPEWIQERPFEEGQSIVLRNIVFETNKDVLLPSSYLTLDTLVNWMRLYPSMEIEVAGHTDDQGSPEYNLDLSKRRAAAVVRYLEEKNIDSKRLQSAGYGSERPLVPNESADNRQINRRVEFTILKL